jgi:predicted  nucleic acid-binding Zn-ribbon protein
MISNIENDEERISEIKNQYDKQQEQVDNFVKKIIKREQQIENQTEKTNVFNEGLKEFTTQRDEFTYDCFIVKQFNKFITHVY